MEEETNLSPRRSPQPISIQGQMDFGSALGKAAEGKKVRRLEWEDKGIYLTFRNGQLMIFLAEDKVLHPLLVSLGDVIGEDWVVVE